MATYVVTDPQTGRKVRLAGDSPPTEQELEEIFSAPSLMKPESRFKPTVGQQVRDFGNEVGRAAALTGRTAANTVAGLPLMFADAGVAWRNLGENVIAGKPPLQKDYELPSEMFQRGMNELGVPQHETTTEKISDFAGQVALGSKLPVPGVAKPAPTAAPLARAPTRADGVIREGEKHGVPVFFDDITDSAVARRVGVAAEPLGPVGTGSGRARQAVAARDAATRVTQSLAPSTGDDVPQLVQKGLQTKLGQFREAARRLYDRVGAELDPAGTMPTPGMQSVIQSELQGQAARGTLAKSDVVSLLTKYQKSPPGNFSAMRQMRSDIADDIAEYYTGSNAAIGEKGVRALQAMKDALEKDMEAFAKQSGTRGYDAWRMADGFYRTNIVPFREAGFRDLVKTAEPEKAWRYLLGQGGLRSRAERMYRSLDESGRGAVRYGMVKDALDNATNPNGSFSPAKFAKYLEDHENTVNTFFKGRELIEITGFQNLMRHVERAGQFAENPPTGQRLIPYLMGGFAATGPIGAKVAAAAAVSGLSVRGLFQTQSGRNLLLAMGRAKPGSAAAARLARQMQGLIVASSNAAGTDAQETDQEAAPQE